MGFTWSNHQLVKTMGFFSLAVETTFFSVYYYERKELALLAFVIDGLRRETFSAMDGVMGCCHMQLIAGGKGAQANARRCCR
jgi:hypothetical protein